MCLQSKITAEQFCYFVFKKNLVVRGAQLEKEATAKDVSTLLIFPLLIPTSCAFDTFGEREIIPLLQD